MGRALHDDLCARQLDVGAKPVRHREVRRADQQKPELRLAQRLRTWMGIDGDPFQFSPSRRLWSAVFECGSLRTAQPNV